MENKSVQICLNMIVKNESHVIKKTLVNLCEKINFSYWCISDTGSTDNTPEIIESFFQEKNIPGELHHDEWKDFAHNRTLALKYAYNKSDLLLVFDADDSIEGDFPIPKPKVNGTFEDAYNVQFGPELKYWRMLLVNNRKKWKFRGVLHEYIECEDKINAVHLQGNYNIIHGVIGDRSRDPNKYSKDAKILEDAFNSLTKDHPDFDLKSRYAFYCANSYKDGGMFDKALEWYIKTVELEGWYQEKYVSCMKICDIYTSKEEHEKAMYYALESYKYDCERVEGIQRLIKHYIAKELSPICYSYYTLIQKFYEDTYLIKGITTNKLFIQNDAYDFYLPYYMIIISDRLNMKELGLKMFKQIFKTKIKVSGWFINHLTINLRYFKETVIKNNDSEFYTLSRSYLRFLEDEKYQFTDEFYTNIYEIKSKLNL